MLRVLCASVVSNNGAMNQTADVVVIGGGINGCSTAYQLARQGVKRVTLVEKGHIASGPTARSSGIVRQHYTLETLACMARDSVKVWENFKDAVGGDAGFHPCGVVSICGPADAVEMRKTVAMHQRTGIRASVLSGEDLRKLEPQLSLEGIALGAYEPDGGYADPALAANSYAEAAERAGVEICRKTLVTGLKVEGGCIRGVITDKGNVDTPAVVNIAGPWGSQIAAMAGVEIPIAPSRHAVAIFQRPPQWRTPTPVWLDLAAGWYYKPEGSHGLMVGSLRETVENQNVHIETYATGVHYEETVAYSEAVVRRFAVMEEGMAQGGWAGLYDVTPDGQPVMDRIAEVEGFFCATGFSGHGFKIGPAVGVIMTELVLHGSCHSYDISMFRHSRFREGNLTRTGYQYSIIG